MFAHPAGNRTLTALGLCLCLGSSAAAQEAPTTWGFFNARYDTETSRFIYAGYGYGRLFGFGGVLANPRSGYTEVVGGAGATFGDGKFSSLVGLAGAKASEAWYAQLYYLPTARIGRTTTRATMEVYFPLEDAGIRQFAVTPVSITVPVSRRIEAGLAGELAAAEGSTSSAWAGPELRLNIPRATIGVDAFAGLTGQGGRMRAFFNASF